MLIQFAFPTRPQLIKVSALFGLWVAIVTGCASPSTPGGQMASGPAPAPPSVPAATYSLPDAFPAEEKGSGKPAGVPEHGPRQSRLVALTFDADMTPFMARELKEGKVKTWYNRDVVRVLEDSRTPATFFTTGMWAELYPQEVRDLASQKLFEVGNHTYSHLAFQPNTYHLAVAKEEEKPWQIRHTSDILARLTGRRPTVFRFPGGIYAAHDLDMVVSQGLIPVQWDVVSGDAFNPDPAAIIRATMKQVRGGSIIVMHLNGGPNAPATAKALPAIIRGLKEKGLQPVTVSELLRK